MKKDIRILFLGTPEISANLLEKLIVAGFNIIGVVAQEDKPVGRKEIVEEVPTKKIAKKYNIPVYQFKKIRENVDKIYEINPDLILTFAFGQIISHEILMIPKYGCLNVHGSLLPKYRGASPIQAALLSGDKVGGVTLMEMVDEMDAGKMYAKEIFDIEDKDNYDSLCLKIVDAGFKVVDQNLEEYLLGNLKGEEQNLEEVTFTKKIKAEDEILDFSLTAFEIHNKIRALSTKPGAYFIYNNEKFKIFTSKIVEKSEGKSGEIIEFDKNGFIIKCSDLAISITQLQRQGKKVMDFKAFYNGNSKLFTVNDIIKNDRN